MSDWDPYAPLEELVVTVLHGHPARANEISHAIRGASGYDPQNAIYVALIRLVRKGCVEKEGLVYRLSPSGRARLRASQAVRTRLRWAGEGAELGPGAWGMGDD